MQGRTVSPLVFNIYINKGWRDVKERIKIENKEL